MTHLLLLLCSLLTRLRAGVETLFPLLLTSAYYGLIFGERKLREVSVFVSHYQCRPFPNCTHPAPSYQVMLVFRPLQTMPLGADEPARVTPQLWPCRRTSPSTLTFCTSSHRKRAFLYPAVLQRTPAFEQHCFNNGCGPTCGLLPQTQGKR